MTPGIAVTVEGTARVDADVAFDAIVPVELPRIFRGHGPLPAVTATHEQTGAWDHVGASRVVELSDGSRVGERITDYQRPRYFAYRVGPFRSGPIRHVLEHANGEWWFTAGEAGGTAIRWTYTFRVRRLALPVVRLLLAPLWRSYARRVLALAVQEAEDSAADTSA